jgi:hypothetical protein
MFVNHSKVQQVLYDVMGEVTTVFPNEIVSERVMPLVKRLPSFKKVDPNKMLSTHNNILIRRTHALGDVVLLFPIVNYLKKIGKNVILCANSQYRLEGLNFMISDAKNFIDRFDIAYNLFGVPELDHCDSTLFEKSRLDIYCDFMGIKDLGIPDWTIPIKCVDFPKDVIGVQLSGSTQHKTINTKGIIKALSKKFKVFIIDRNKPKFNRPNVLHERVDNATLLAYINKMIGIVCFDSGPLWLSHVANTPAFVIVGPTSGKKVTKYHPNSNTTFYDTKTGVKCKRACGESMHNCKGKYSCMKSVNQVDLLSKINDWSEAIV